MVLLSRWIAKRTRKGFREQQKHLGELNGIIEETLTGQHVVKAYAREQAVIEDFEIPTASCEAGVHAGPDLCRVRWARSTNLVNNVGFAIVAGAGGWMAVQGLATVGTIASFVNYARRFRAP